ncbi:hypothetical protein [Campylobacter sp. 19-13652]|uniref:hypothetical protein n=1 Tax=Campylobacter sp. 19-13652 TaxID=2840180 RepID=UPI001C7623AF|nr:hypothetical protein [Campylobacter sp. 19-13652]BCX78553.1 pilus assembly protein CpaE [Campylobacter sp. 19-13652]
MKIFSKIDNKVKTVLIISENTQRIEEIKQRLALQGINDFSIINKNLSNLNSNELEFDYWGVVCDISKSTDAKTHIDIIIRLFANELAKVVIGDSDSITLKQNFEKRGISYLHFGSEANQIYDKLVKFNTNETKNYAIKIAVIGCKGGIGTSFCAYHIARLIYDRFSTPTLLVQGANSSLNIDILSGINFEKEHFRANGLSLYKQNQDENFEFSSNKFKQFNFIIFDYSVQALQKELCEDILNHCDTAILLSDTSVASVRKAKEIIKVNRFLKSVNKGASKLVFYINTPYKINHLSTDQIEKIAETKIDLILPNAGNSELGAKLNRKAQIAFQTAIDNLTGSKKASKFWLFKAR